MREAVARAFGQRKVFIRKDFPTTHVVGDYFPSVRTRPEVSHSHWRSLLTCLRGLRSRSAQAEAYPHVVPSVVIRFRRGGCESHSCDFDRACLAGFGALEREATLALVVHRRERLSCAIEQCNLHPEI